MHAFLPVFNRRMVTERAFSLKYSQKDESEVLPFGISSLVQDFVDIKLLYIYPNNIGETPQSYLPMLREPPATPPQGSPL